MTIKVITSARKERHICTYDFEWRPDNQKIRLCGMYDGERYRSFPTIDGFMKHILTERYNQHWFFAHAGGTFDCSYLLGWLLANPQFRVHMYFANSAAVKIEVERGWWDARQKKWRVLGRWFFLDSYFLLRTGLRNIAKWFGLEKGGEAGSQAIFYAPYAILRDYNEQDCVILHKAIAAFSDMIDSFGGELAPTIASTAMKLFRRQYLQANIRTMPQINTLMREGYIASRVEVFRKEIFNANQYDINSSFPFSMTKPAPGEFQSSAGYMPEGTNCFFSDVTIEVPESAIPPLPYRYGGKVFYPTGSWRSWMSGVDVRFLERHGGRIIKLHETHLYDERTDMAEYVHDLYEKRRASKDDAEKIVIKFLLNSLYGKFAERTEKTTIHLNASNRRKLMEVLKDRAGQVIKMGEEIMPGAILVTERRDVAHEHVPFAVHVTALSRELIGDYLINAYKTTGELPAYADTDCIVTKAELPTSDRLGDLKLEKRIEHGEFIAPKLYKVDGKVKAKGFTGISDAGFDLLRAGATVKLERSARPRELLRSGDLRPRVMEVPKRLLLKDEKRVFSDGGNHSRPYSVEEIREQFKAKPGDLNRRRP